MEIVLSVNKVPVRLTEERWMHITTDLLLQLRMIMDNNNVILKRSEESNLTMPRINEATDIDIKVIERLQQLEIPGFPSIKRGLRGVLMACLHPQPPLFRALKAVVEGVQFKNSKISLKGKTGAAEEKES